MSFSNYVFKYFKYVFWYEIHLFYFVENLTEILRHHGAYNGLLHIMLYSILAHIVKQLGMAPGGEFRTAFKEVN